MWSWGYGETLRRPIPCPKVLHNLPAPAPDCTGVSWWVLLDAWEIRREKKKKCWEGEERQIVYWCIRHLIPGWVFCPTEGLILIPVKSRGGYSK